MILAALIAFFITLTFLCPWSLIMTIPLLMWVVVAANQQATREKESREAVAKALAESLPNAMRFKGSLIGGNHPLLGSSKKDMEIVLSSDTVTAIWADNPGGVVLPLRNVKAQVTTQSGVTAAGILMYGALALAAKDTITVLDIEDEASKERYTAVFKMQNNESFADQVNRRRYAVLTSSKEAISDDQ
jgi:hypothetical protein